MATKQKKTNTGPRSGKDRVIAATVRLPTRGGLGVLVPGGYILTAAHCIHWEAGGMALDADHYLEQVTTKSGAKLTLAVLAADPVSDIAVLGAPDDQQFSDECEAFEEWCNSVEAVSLSGGFDKWCKPAKFGERQTFNVHVRTHTDSWIAATAARTYFDQEKAGVWIQASQAIKSGTSGGPIVDDTGALVALVSFSEEVESDGHECNGAAPMPRNALPRWVLAGIERASE